LLSFVPVHFAVYRPLKPRLRWAMQCLVGYADHAGRCFPSLRTFAVQAGISKSAAGRDLAELEAEGHLTRTRRPGGVYVYRIARKFLPHWTREQVSQQRDRQREVRHARRAEASLRGVPEPGTEEKTEKKNQRDARARFARKDITFGELPDERIKWEARLRSWRQSRFWLPLWGPKPTEPGCFAPPSMTA
jgi:DNA-binding transcriptional regulator YhcF (GntR family)